MLPKVDEGVLRAHQQNIAKLENPQDVLAWLKTEYEKLQGDNPLLLKFLEERAKLLAGGLMEVARSRVGGSIDAIAHSLSVEYILILSLMSVAFDKEKELQEWLNTAGKLFGKDGLSDLDELGKNGK